MNRYRWYVLGLLWAVAVLRFVDLQILAVLLEPIKQEFQFSDTQLALLGGLAFALFYGILGLPVAWLADRCNRRNIIAASVSLWSLMTALCGSATGFTSLFLARMGVGIGEAGAYPPSTSLLADYFSPRERPLACSILASAIPVGVFVGFMVGGVVAQYWGWRTAFQVVGWPGVVIGVLVFFSLREPLRGATEPQQQASPAAAQETMKASLRILLGNRLYRQVLVASCLFTLGAAGSGVWIPAYFMRHHSLAPAEAGFWMAILYGGAGLLGALCSGYCAGRIEQPGSPGSGAARVCALSLMFTLPIIPFIFHLPQTAVALGFLGIMAFLMHMNTGPVLVLLQQCGGCRRRAMAHAVSVLVSNLVALPLGPLFVGLCSDLFSAQYGSAVLGWAILTLLLATWSTSSWFFIKVLRNLEDPDTDAGGGLAGAAAFASR